MVQDGDLVIRRTTANGFELIEALTARHIAGPFEYFAVAVAAARARGPHAIWQVSVDHRGRILGDLFRLPLRARRDNPLESARLVGGSSACCAVVSRES